MKVLITTSKHCASYQLALLLKNDEVLFGDNFTDFPSAESNSTAHQILKFCLDHQVEQVFPLAFAEVAELRKSLILFEEFGIEVMLSEESLQDLTQADKEANSFVELSTGLIALGYPNKKIAIADASGRGELLLIDDTVTDNLQVWNGIKSMSFNQIGKWFNQANFSPVTMFQLNEELQQSFVLFKDDELLTLNVLNSEVVEKLKTIAQTRKLKGLYAVAIANQTILRIINTTF